ncbi:TonB-dependent receptor domain-containing protein [Hyphomonas sp.]|uniref:TonB-dependent receptor n=1 Tax=Hyphomonas sp. TaxID=87 RepID=UPI00391C0065
MIKNFFVRSASVAALAALAPVAAVYAQETASELRGTIIDQNGAAVAGATVTITHQPTGSTSTLTTGNNGNFFQTGLRPGGPYSIFVTAPGFEGEALGDIRLSPGTSPALRIRLASADDTAVMGVVTVTGSAISQLDLNNGVGSNFSARDVANQPSLTRDLISTLNRDPLAISGGANNLSVAGVNPRFNAVTIDGARQQDNLGLGSNTFPTARSPINIDIVESVSLVASDYSVTASGFTGGLVNVTTRGGTNEIDGSAFYYYRDQDWLGTKTFGGEGSFNPGIFEEKEYGVTLRGPILKDRLFFSLSYDKFETAQQIDITGNLGNLGINPQLYTALNQLVLDTYGIDMGGRPLQAAVPETTERIFARIDWDINNNHRLQLQFQDTEETSVANSTNALAFQSAWYDTPQKLTSYTAQLFSDWSPNFSTRLRASYTENERLQNCRGGTGVGEIRMELNTPRVAGTPLEGLITSGNTVRAFIGGCDVFRHTNTYADERLTLFAQGDYVWNDFIFTFGGEFESLDAANGFSQFSQGQFVFTGNNAGQNLINRIANVNYRNVRSNNVAEYLTQYAYDRYTAFGQARWQVMPELELSAGLRYEYISTDSGAANDPTFLAQVGIPNTKSTDGLDLIMPRLGFRWEPLSRTTVSGGFGLFSGGDPGVWTLNAAAPLVVIPPAINNLANVDPRQVPQALLDAVANGTVRAIDAIDPNFKLPSDWKASLRVDQSFDLNFGGVDLGRDYRASFQVLHTRSKDSFLWQEYAQTNGGLTPGVAPDGRPIYADLQALGLSNRTVLTNASGDESYVYTFSLEKAFDNGFDFYLAYSHQDVEALTEGSSSRGVSAFRGQVAADRNNPGPRTSLYQVEDAFKLSLGYERDFISDLTTRVDLFGQFDSGRPFTYSYVSNNTNALFGRTGNNENPFANNPLYVPDLFGDPKVVYGPNFNLAAFGDYVRRNGIEQGKIHEVNSAAGTWNQRWDFRIQQDLPGIWGARQFVGDNRFKLVFDVENFGNLLNDKWGTIHNSPGNGQLAIVNADLVRRSDVQNVGIAAAPALTLDSARTACTTQDSCVYRYNSFSNQNVGSRNNAASVWKARIGIRYEF